MGEQAHIYIVMNIRMTFCVLIKALSISLGLHKRKLVLRCPALKWSVMIGVLSNGRSFAGHRYEPAAFSSCFASVGDSCTVF